MAETTGEVEANGIWVRLRRRKVVQWGLLYSAAAWTLAQGSAYLVDTFDLPRPWQQASALLLLAGFPIALTVAWFHGDRGHQRIGRLEAIVIAACLLAGGILLWRYPYSDRATSVEHSAAAPTGSSQGQPSIAVLPFVNRSDRREDEYFVDGIQNDILTQLSQVRALRVISRTSSSQFRSTNLTTREIGSRLGVTNLLEGGVQRAGGRVRVTVQLIDAATDAHVWAEAYDRELNAQNIFSIQSEIAAAVTGALRASLTPAEQQRAQQIPTANLQAWEAYQIGRLRQANRGSQSLAEAAVLLQRSIDLDPQFAVAYAALAQNLILQVDIESVDREPAVERARVLVDRALQMDPRLAEAVTTRAALAEMNGDLPLAEKEYLRAIELNPNHARALHWYSSLLQTLGRVEESLRFAEDAVRLDPLAAVLQINLGGARASAGQFDRALDAYLKAVEIDPSMANAQFNVGALHAFGFGRIDEGLPWIEEAVRLDPDASRYWLNLVFLRLQLGGAQRARAEREIDRAVREGRPAGEIALLIKHLNRGSLESVRAVAQRMWSEWPRGGLALVVLRNLDLQAGRLAHARDLYLQAFPEFASAGPLVVDAGTFHPAVDCATVLRRLGDDRSLVQMERLLAAVEVYLRRTTRMGIDGHQFTGAVVLAIRGQDAAALQELEELDRQGLFYAWRYVRDSEPAFDALRGDPRFQAVFRRVESRMATQLARVEARPQESRPP